MSKRNGRVTPGTKERALGERASRAEKMRGGGKEKKEKEKREREREKKKRGGGRKDPVGNGSVRFRVIKPVIGRLTRFVAFGKFAVI